MTKNVTITTGTNEITFYYTKSANITPAPTPTPTDPTPTPANPTPTPSSQITKAAQDVIDRIKELNAQTITLEKKATVQSIRTAYNALSDTEKAQVSNYNLLVQA